MKAIFWTRHERGVLAQSDWRETNLAQAIQSGAKACGDEVEIRTVPDDGEVEVIPCDLVCKIGVKSRFWFEAYRKAGIPWLYFDKGYIRERAPTQWLTYWRLSVNQHHPIAFMAEAKKDRTRADRMGFRFDKWRTDRGRHVIVDGGSAKNYAFNGLGDPDERARALVKQLEALTPERPIIYRPKPSWKAARQIEGTEFARGRAGVHVKDVKHDLERAHVVVSYSSAICYDAHRIGIPSIVLGGGPARPISSTSLDDIEHPRLASDQERQQWLNNLAWCQFEMPEYADGTAWRIVREMVDCSPL